MFGGNKLKINKYAWNWHIKTYFVLNFSSVFFLSAKIIAILTKIISYLNPYNLKNIAINYTFNSFKSSA